MKSLIPRIIYCDCNSSATTIALFLVAAPVLCYLKKDSTLKKVPRWQEQIQMQGPRAS
jgi:hypothetical protein